MNKELKPCPFCGHDAIIKTKERLHTTSWFVIKCSVCGAMIKSRNFSEFDMVFCCPPEAEKEWNALDEKWNRRANNDRQN